MKKYMYFNMVTHRVREWDELSQDEQYAFQMHRKDPNLTVVDDYTINSSTLPEFSRVINVSFGYSREVDGVTEWKSSSVNGLDEVNILRKTSAVLDAFASADYAFAGYNVSYFDIPFLTKRFIINGIRIPDSIRRYDKKYWEINDFNLKQFWKFNGGAETPLEVICSCLKIDLGNELDIYDTFKSRIDDINFDEISKLSEKRNELVHAVHNRVIDLIEE